MRFTQCARTSEVKNLLALGHWPHACPLELRAHLLECRACADLVLLTETFSQSRNAAMSNAKLVTPEALWWRAQMHRRFAAVERARRPVFGAQIVGLFFTLALAIGFAGYQARHGIGWLTWMEELPQTAGFHLGTIGPAALSFSSPSLLVLAPLLAVVALFGGVAVYLASDNH